MEFTKYPALYCLEERHGMELGMPTKLRTIARIFTHYIAQHQRSSFMVAFNKAHFFSIYARFFLVKVPKKIDCLGFVLQEIGISNVLNKNCARKQLINQFLLVEELMVP